MKIGAEGVALIKKWEGCAKRRPDGTLAAYDDGEGVPTIGYGSTHGVTMQTTCTQAEADAMLSAELEATEQAIAAAITAPLTQGQFDALASFVYNVGKGWLGLGGHKPATFIRALNAGEYAAVPAGLLQFSRGANSAKVYPGLLARRRDEAALWRRSAAPEPPVQMPAPELPPQQPRAVTESAPAPAGSRKLGLIGLLRAIAAALGLTGVMSESPLDLSRLEQTKSYVAATGAPKLLGMLSQHPGAALAAGAIAAFVAFEALRQWHLQDFAAGRWIPSGEDK